MPVCPFIRREGYVNGAIPKTQTTGKASTPTCRSRPCVRKYHYTHMPPNYPWRQTVTETVGGAEGDPAGDTDERSGRPGRDTAIVTEEEATCLIDVWLFKME